MTDLLQLAERVEKATGPDRELDEAIARAFGWSPVPNPTNAGGLFGRWYQPDGNLSGMEGPPQWSRSLDAAMTLVPEGYVWGAGSWGNPDNDGPWAWCDTKQNSKDNDLDYGKAATPALALTAAALRARATRSATEANLRCPRHSASIAIAERQ